MRFIKTFEKLSIKAFMGWGKLAQKLWSPMIFWMGSYLTDRTQCIQVGDYLSETIYCHSGVPQGSHLGALKIYS
jgi:hypothetical protein